MKRSLVAMTIGLACVLAGCSSNNAQPEPGPTSEPAATTTVEPEPEPEPTPEPLWTSSECAEFKTAMADAKIQYLRELQTVGLDPADWSGEEQQALREQAATQMLEGKNRLIEAVNNEGTETADYLFENALMVAMSDDLTPAVWAFGMYDQNRNSIFIDIPTTSNAVVAMMGANSSTFENWDAVDAFECD